MLFSIDGRFNIWTKKSCKLLGFKVVDRGCCGTCKIEVIFLCNHLEPTCANDSDYENSKLDEASKDETPASEPLIDEDSILRANKRQILEENKNPKELLTNDEPINF